MSERPSEERRVDRIVVILIIGAVLFWTVPDLVFWWYGFISPTPPGGVAAGIRHWSTVFGIGLLITGIVLFVRMRRHNPGL